MRRTPLHLLLLLSGLLAVPGCREDPTANAAPQGPSPALAAAPTGTPELAPPGAPLTEATSEPNAPAAGPFDTAKLPAVVARVDGEEIGKAEVVERANAMRAQMVSAGAPAPPQSEELYRAMVDQLIGARLLLAEAKRRGLTATDAELTESVAKLKARDPDGFARQLAAQHMTEKAFASELAPDLAIRKLVATDVAPGVKIGEEVARRFYQQNLDRMRRPPQVRVRHILVAVQQEAATEQRQEARKKAESLLGRLQAGADFAALARESSDDRGSREQGGMLPWLSPGESVPPFDRAAFALQPGQTSGVVESPFGFHLLRVEEKREASTVSFEEARPQIEELLSRQQARELLDRKVAALRKAARVEVLF